MSSHDTYSDPSITANIYASGLLDDLIRSAIVPFRRDLRSLSEDSYFWMLRYSKGGQHLKIRVHCQAHRRDDVKEILGTHVERYLSSIAEVPSETRISRPKLPAIDIEDQRPVEFPDRSLVWTTYKRSHVTLGTAPWVTDDSFAALAYECLAQGCGLVLDAIEAGALDSHGARQKLLLKALLSGLRALGLGFADQAADYLQYHRDWLLRFFIPETQQEQRKLEEFEEQVIAMSATVERLKAIAEEQWSSQNTSSGDGWHNSLLELAAFTRRFQDCEEYQIDPFTSNVTFPPAFKMFHGLANQIGVAPLTEAFVHHLLLRAVALPHAATAMAGNGRRL